MDSRHHPFFRHSTSLLRTAIIPVLLILCVYSDPICAFSEDKITAALLYNIFKNVVWPEENQKMPFVVLTYGVNNDFHRLLVRELTELKVREMPIEVRRIISQDELLKWAKAKDGSNQSISTEGAKPAPIPARVLLIGRDKNSDVSYVAALLRRSGILLVTQESTNKRDVMVNLKQQSNLVGFEINRSNIIYEGLVISKQILLLGGSELDVATLHRETEDQLQKSKRAYEALEHSIAKQMKQKAEAIEQIKTLKEKMNQQQRMLDVQSGTIEVQRQTLLENSHQLSQSNEQLLALRSELKKMNIELERVGAHLDQTRAELKKNEVTLESSRSELEHHRIAKESLLSRIEANTAVLEHQEQKIVSQASVITEQKTTLGKQSKTIAYQRTLIVVVGMIVIAILLLIYLILRGYREKKRLADQLAQKNQHINDTLKALQRTQQQLIESEKFASLGELVAGVAHEINTPIGIAVTLTSDLQDRLSVIEAQLKNQTLTETSLSRFCEGAQARYDILFKHIHRAADLVKSFKEVAVDYSSNERRTFNLKAYVDECLQSLSSKINHTRHRVIVECPDTLEVDSYPGALFQIISILILNSLEHAFKGIDCGEMYLTFTVKKLNENDVEEQSTEDDQLHLIYKDNGVGACDEVIKKIFNPFFTTERSNGGSGLGAHIMYNIVTQVLQGRIRCKRSDIAGLQFDIWFPLALKKDRNLKGIDEAQLA